MNRLNSYELSMMIAMVLLVFLALIPAVIAKRKGRSFVIWYIYGYFMWIVALCHAIVLPKPRAKDDQELLAEAREMDEEQGYQDVVVTSSRITDCYVSSPVDALSYQVIKNKQSRRLICKVNLFSTEKIMRIDIRLTLKNYLGEKMGEMDFVAHPFGEVLELDISDYLQTTFVEFDYRDVVLEDGSVWQPSGQKVRYDIDMVDSHHLEEVKSLTNKYAFCYPHEYEDYWVCACSKANNQQNCVLCGIDKQKLFATLSPQKIHEMKNEEKIRKNLENFQASQAEKMLYREE